MLLPEELAAIEAKYPEAFRPGPLLRPQVGAATLRPLPRSAVIEAAIADYRQWRAVVAATRTGDPRRALAVRFWRRAHDRLARSLRPGRVYVADDGQRYSYDGREDSLVIAPPLTYAKKDREAKADVTPTPDSREHDRLEAAHHAWEARLAVRRERPRTRAVATITKEDRDVLMVELEPAEAIYLPTPDGREIRLAAPATGAEPTHSLTITIPTLASTDRIELVIGGRRLLVAGAELKRGATKRYKTRIALDLPEACRVRYPGRDRKPLKPREVN